MNNIRYDSPRTGNSTVFSLTLSYEMSKTTTIMENKTEIQTVTKKAATLSFPAISDVERTMLVRAINNRTRERNYANICLQLAEGQITEEEFENEIMNNENKYVISFADKTSPEEIQIAAQLAAGVLDIETEEDFRELFSISSASFTNFTKAIGQ